MKGDAKVIEFLNEALKNELTAVNQYWLHYRMLDNWGVAALAHFERHESIDEMKHADRLAERILFLEGLPNFQLLGRLRIGETVEEILKAVICRFHRIETVPAWPPHFTSIPMRRVKHPKRPAKCPYLWRDPGLIYPRTWLFEMNGFL